MKSEDKYNCPFCDRPLKKFKNFEGVLIKSKEPRLDLVVCDNGHYFPNYRGLK